METSALNGANGTRAHGIVPLSMKEIEMVAGGKAAQTPPRSFWERILNWIGGGDTAPPPPATPVMPPPESLMEACLAAGGTFTYEYSTGGGSANLRIVRADGTGTTVRITCEL